MLANCLKHVTLLITLTALVMLTNLGSARLWDRDEPRNAGCAREMYSRGDLVIPTFNGLLRTHKPVLLYWCIMASYSALGVNEFAARLPSALCAIGTVLCTYSMGRRLFGITAGLWSGVALATSLMFVLAGRAATPDSLLIFCTTLAMAIYVRGTFKPRFESTPLGAPPDSYSAILFPQHWPTVLAMYAAMGLAVLAKGPVGLVLPTATIGLYLLITRLPRRDREHAPTLPGLLSRVFAPFEPLHFLTTCWIMRPFTGLFAAAAVALPWYWAVGLATDGEFLRGFFFEHNLNRATAPMENHGGTILFYPVAILVGFFPWSVFAAPLILDTALQLRRSRASSSLTSDLRPVTTDQSPLTTHSPHLLPLCWLALYLTVFSIARTKLPSYVTPCYPALALLAGDYIDRVCRQAAAVAGNWLIAAYASFALIGVAIAVAIPLVAKQQLPGEEWLGLIGVLPIAGGVACLGLAAVRSFRASAATFAATAAAFAVFLFAFGTQQLDRHQTNHRLFEAIFARSPNPQIASYRILEPSWVFYTGRTVHEFTPAPGEPAAPTANATAHFLLSRPDAFVITTAQKAAELTPLLPPGIGPLAETPYFLHKNQNLLVLGHQTPAPAFTSHHLPLTTHQQ